MLSLPLYITPPFKGHNTITLLCSRYLLNFSTLTFEWSGSQFLSRQLRQSFHRCSSPVSIHPSRLIFPPLSSPQITFHSSLALLLSASTSFALFLRLAALPLRVHLAFQILYQTQTSSSCVASNTAKIIHLIIKHFR